MRFNLSKEKVDTLKEYFIRIARGRLKVDEFLALQNITFSLEKGTVLGIVGLNGSGKSTLLKIISRILKPTKGTVKTFGTISPLIELGAGFDADLTARENIFLNGAVLGHSHAVMKIHFDEIIAFSELSEFVDVPIKNFSSGMIARLGFSIATITKPDILILDEILAVGDFLFQKKCEERIKSMIDGGTTVLIVSHSIEQIERLCDNVMWLEKGQIKLLGNTRAVCNAYRKLETQTEEMN